MTKKELIKKILFHEKVKEWKEKERNSIVVISTVSFLNIFPNAHLNQIYYLRLDFSDLFWSRVLHLKIIYRKLGLGFAYFSNSRLSLKEVLKTAEVFENPKTIFLKKSLEKVLLRCEPRVRLGFVKDFSGAWGAICFVEQVFGFLCDVFLLSLQKFGEYKREVFLKFTCGLEDRCGLWSNLYQKKKEKKKLLS